MLFSTPGSRLVCAEDPRLVTRNLPEIPTMERNGNEDDLQGADEEEEVDPRIQVRWG